MTRSSFLRSRLLARPPGLLWTLILGALFVSAPTFLRAIADPVIEGTAFVTYYPFVLVAALIIGWRGAVGVTLAAALLANFLFMEPRYVLFGTVSDSIGVAFFVISCSMMIFLVDTLRRTVVEVEAGLQREADLNAQARHLNAELQHRVKNTLSVVQALATHSFRSLPGGEESARLFRGRLHALAEAHEILTSGKWELCRLPDLAIRALAPFSGHGAINIDGPACSLPEQSCVPLVLALHELGTNAAKYGALSTLDGCVTVRWHLRPSDGDQDAHELVLDWTENGGPPVAPPTRKGLGSRLVAAQTGIDAVTTDFRPEGFACRIVARGALSTTDV